MKTKQFIEYQKVENAFNKTIVSKSEWVTDIYKKEDERWLCVLTHLTPVF
jgi:hypothetical protein